MADSQDTRIAPEAPQSPSGGVSARVVPLARRHGRALFYADRRIVEGMGWKRARWMAVCEYDGEIVEWWPVRDQKTAHWLAGVRSALFAKRRALLTQCGSQFILKIEGEDGEGVLWTGEDQDAARAELGRLEGCGIVTLDLTDAAA